MKLEVHDLAKPEPTLCLMVSEDECMTVAIGEDTDEARAALEQLAAILEIFEEFAEGDPVGVSIDDFGTTYTCTSCGNQDRQPHHWDCTWIKARKILGLTTDGPVQTLGRDAE